ncbi:MAG: CCA tRNA nucleotidyltransferase [Shimia sp.]
MRIDPDWARSAASRAVMGALDAAGARAWFVGGCVRNALMGAPVTDLDIATDARPDAVTAAARAAGLKAIPTGVDHGTVTVVAEGTPFEVTTLRRDVETDGRHAVVAFADTIEEDAARRDFTVNALYLAPDGTVVDPTGGLRDLPARRFRFIGDAEARIREDYLRILRFFRFFAWYGDDLDADGLAACASLSGGLETLSAERITAELRRLLAAPDPAPAVASMAAAGVLHRILPGADPALVAPLVHVEGAAPPDPIRRLAALGGDTGGLRLSKAERRTFEAIRADAPVTERARAFVHGADAAMGWALLRQAAGGPPPDAEAIAEGAAARLPVRAPDLPEAGPALGARLRRIEAAWIDSDLTLDRAALLAVG